MDDLGISLLTTPVVNIPALKWDIEKIREDYEGFCNRFPFDDRNQLNLTRQPHRHGNPYDGISNLFNRDTREWFIHELEFSQLLEELKGTYLERIYLDISNHVPLRLGRCRLMRLEPGSSYSVHADQSLRIHVPIITNSSCFLIFPGNGSYHLPADGACYLTNTKILHTAHNGGHQSRIHLVISAFSLDEAP